MGIVLFLVFGFAIGLIARALMPGDQKMGIPMTIGLGVAGSFIGGFVVSSMTDHRVTDFHTAGIIGSVTGALILLFVGSLVSRRQAHA